MNDVRRAHRLRLVLAFAAVYLIWGSTYLAIRVAIDTIPPLIMAGTRLLFGGLALLAWARLRGAALPTFVEWRSAALIGVMLLAVGNGTVTWSEQRVPSGLVALMVATVPIWMSLLTQLGIPGPARRAPGAGASARPEPGTVVAPAPLRPRGSARVWLGILLGVCGITLLIGPGAIAGGGHIDRIAALSLALSSLSWALGSLIARRIPLPVSPLMATGAEMSVAGVVLTLFALAAGEGPRLHLAAITPASLLAFVYLVTFGSIVAFTAYVWLLRVTSPARVSTYAFVNPVVAVVLGWAFLGEALTPRTGIAAAIIVGAVATITSQPVPAPATPVAPEETIAEAS